LGGTGYSVAGGGGAAADEPVADELLPRAVRAKSNLGRMSSAAEGAGMLAVCRGITHSVTDTTTTAGDGNTQQVQLLQKTIMGVAWEKHLQQKYGRVFLSKLASRSQRSLQSDGSGAADRVPLSERGSVVSQLLSFEFAFILLFSMVFFTRASLYLGLLGEFLSAPAFAAHGFNADDSAAFVNIISAMVPCGALFAPVIDPVIQRMGFLWYSLWVALMGVAYSLCMLVPSMHMQVLGAFFFTYYRANVFAFPGIYNLTVFGGRTVGTVQGLSQITSNQEIYDRTIFSEIDCLCLQCSRSARR